MSHKNKLTISCIKILYLNKFMFSGKKLDYRCLTRFYQADIYLLKVNNKNTRARCEICLKLTINTPEWQVNNKDTRTKPERRYWLQFDLFIANFEHISHLVLVFLFLTLSMQIPAGQTLFSNMQLAQTILSFNILSFQQVYSTQRWCRKSPG